MRLKGGLEERGFHLYPWGIELPFKLIPRRHDMTTWLLEANIEFYYHEINYEFWFKRESDRILFYLTWAE